MKDKTIIFDFDGTIANTFDQVVEIVFKEAKHSKFKLTKKEIKTLIRTKSLREVLKTYHINKLKLIYGVWKIRKELRSKIHETKPYKGVEELLLTLKEQGYTLGLLTSNKKNNVLPFLQEHNIDVFDFHYYKASIFKKTNAFKKIIKRHKLNLNQILYVGDELRDVVSSREAGIKCISVTWGYNGLELIKKGEPDFIVDKPEEILKVIEKFKI